MIATKEQFEAYEKVRRSGTVDMFSVKAIVEASGVPEDVIADIIENFTQYQRFYGDKQRNISWSNGGDMHYISIVLAHYDDLCELFGQPHIHPIEDDGTLGIVWAVKNPDGGAAAIYNFEDSVISIGDEHGIPNDKIVKWWIDASDEQTFRAAVSQIFERSRERFRKSEA